VRVLISGTLTPATKRTTCSNGIRENSGEILVPGWGGRPIGHHRRQFLLCTRFSVENTTTTNVEFLVGKEGVKWWRGSSLERKVIRGRVVSSGLRRNIKENSGDEPWRGWPESS